MSKTEIRDGMKIDWDVPIEMDDGIVLRCDVYRPIEEDKFPVILSYGPYGKYLAFQDGYVSCWERMAEEHPDVTAGSTNKYQSWEVVDPEKWVPHGYAIVRVDSRGCGRSPGYVEVWSPREAKDLYHCVEWAARQSWSNGKIGLNGISYYAMNQWQVAPLQPPHLAAMCAWEGAADFYRDVSHHGGILCTFMENWYDMQVKSVQHGLGKRGYRSRLTGGWVSGPLELTDEELGANREDLGNSARDHAMDDDYWKSRSPDWSKVVVPFLSSANWGGKAFTRAAISRPSHRPRPRGSGLNRMGSNTGPSSIRTMDERFRRPSLTIISKARGTVGTSVRGCSSRFVMWTNSWSDSKMNGPSHVPSGRGSISIRAIPLKPSPIRKRLR